MHSVLKAKHDLADRDVGWPWILLMPNDGHGQRCPGMTTQGAITRCSACCRYWPDPKDWAEGKGVRRSVVAACPDLRRSVDEAHPYCAEDSRSGVARPAGALGWLSRDGRTSDSCLPREGDVRTEIATQEKYSMSSATPPGQGDKRRTSAEDGTMTVMVITS